MQEKILVTFGASYLSEFRGADLAARSATFTALVLGVIGGLLVVDFVLARIRPVKLLFVTAAIRDRTPARARTNRGSIGTVVNDDYHRLRTDWHLHYCRVVAL